MSFGVSPPALTATSFFPQRPDTAIRVTMFAT